MAKGIVVNTFRELEVKAVKAVEDGDCFPDRKRTPPRIYCIGPLIADAQQP
ncbi:anthocyanidin 53-O-glucosyltransferase-like, partial [Trifolium medium]|nr:anthocyanidin 53-O-glucosyltransferase-like [Trifolium medium]